MYPCMRARPAPRGSSVPRAARASSSAGGPSDRRPSGRSRRRCTFGGPASSRGEPARPAPDRGPRAADRAVDRRDAGSGRDDKFEHTQATT